eukprot:1158074-Pelagomonas_calceolata.AAC.4
MTHLDRNCPFRDRQRFSSADRQADKPAPFFLSSNPTQNPPVQDQSPQAYAPWAQVSADTPRSPPAAVGAAAAAAAVDAGACL